MANSIFSVKNWEVERYILPAVKLPKTSNTVFALKIAVCGGLSGRNTDPLVPGNVTIPLRIGTK